MEASDVNADHSYNMYNGIDNLATGDGATTEDISQTSEKDHVQSEFIPNDDKNNHQIEPGGNVADGTVKDECPFVCGICPEKFDNVNLFYAHLKTHENLIGNLNQENQEKNLPGGLKDHEKEDDSVFKCGICWMKFMSMSLLHEHMIGDENIADYSYSNVDHTARPDSRIVMSQSDTDSDTEDDMKTASSPREGVSNLGEKEKVITSSTSGTQTDEKHKRKSKENDGLKTSASTDKTKQKKLIKNGSGTKRKNEETNKFQKKRKTKEDSKNILPVSNAALSSVIHTYGTRGNLSPATRSSRRVNCKRVDYKALAGLNSLKYDSETDPDVSKAYATNEKDTNIDFEKIQNETQIETQIVEKDVIHSDTGNLEKDKKLMKGTSKNKKTYLIKVAPEKKDTNIKSEKEKNPKENTEKMSGIEDEVKSAADDIEGIEESNAIAENDTGFNELAVKTDGTSLEADSEFPGVIKVEVDSDYDYNASDYDSDDDFGEENSNDEVYQDDEQNDPDFKPQMEPEDDGEDGVIVSLNDTQDPDAHLKNFKVKKKRIYKNKEGQPVKNCLYACGVCGRYYLWKALKKHMYAHVTRRVVQCFQCGKKYKSERHLKDHVRSVHEMKKYGCPKCSSILKGNQSFDKHIMTHILKKEITEALDEVEKVEVPDEDYLMWKAQQENKISKYPKKKRQKNLEVEDIPDGLDLEILKEGPLHGQHILLESDIVGTSKNQDCKICKRHFVTHESLLTHMLEHKDEENFSCKVCKGFFQTEEHLINHMSSVHGERDLVCDICGEHLRSRYALWSHKGKHLMKKDEYYSEEIVQKLQEEMPEKGKYKRKSGKKNETKQCEVCGMVVLTVRYNRHLEVHNTTKEWECDICHNFYKTRRYLIDHKKKTHFAELVACEICGQRFKGKTYLEIHKQTHGPRDKKCPHCDKGFTTMLYLKTHLLTHEEKKRFRCEKCMAAFSHKQRLTIHMVEVHGEGASRPCKYCGDLFPSRQKARRHERTAHEGFVMPVRIKKKPNYVNVLKINEADNESLENKIVRLMPSGSGLVSLTPGMIKVPIAKNSTIETNIQNSIENKIISDSTGVGSAASTGQFIKFENGEEYQVMIEKDGSRGSLEFVELSEEEQNVIIQEADGITPLINDQEENVEQILEIPETAEQCQILLYPDGTFKLLNVVDNVNSN